MTGAPLLAEHVLIGPGEMLADLLDASVALGLTYPRREIGPGHGLAGLCPEDPGEPEGPRRDSKA